MDALKKLLSYSVAGPARPWTRERPVSGDAIAKKFPFHARPRVISPSAAITNFDQTRALVAYYPTMAEESFELNLLLSGLARLSLVPGDLLPEPGKWCRVIYPFAVYPGGHRSLGIFSTPSRSGAPCSSGRVTSITVPTNVPSSASGFGSWPNASMPVF